MFKTVCCSQFICLWKYFKLGKFYDKHFKKFCNGKMSRFKKKIVELWSTEDLSVNIKLSTETTKCD